MSRPDAEGPAQDRQYRLPAGLLEKLMAAVRPEFWAANLVFDPRDPVFGGPPCAVNGCDRPHRRHGLCISHGQRWRGSGISLKEFTATAERGWHGHLPLDPCVISGCNYGAMGHGMCSRHFSRWYRAGSPDPERWQAQVPQLALDGPPRTCRIGFCSLWTRSTSVFCYGHDTRWKNNGRPDIDEFTVACENPGPGQEHIDLRRLPAGLRLEMQYVLQCRGDEQTAKLPPRELHPFAVVLAGAGASSLLEQPEEWWTALYPPMKGRGWRPFILDARRRIGDARVRRRLGHRVPAGHLATLQPGHRQARGRRQLRGNSPGLAAGAGQETHPLAADYRSVRQHGRQRDPGRDAVRRLDRRPARTARRAGRRDPPAA